MRKVSVSELITLSLNHVKTVLFAPFSSMKWFKLLIMLVLSGASIQGRLIKHVLLIFVLWLIWGTNVICADDIRLKNGTEIKASIVEQSKSWIKLNVEGMTITYYLDEIDSINGNPIQTITKDSSIKDTQNSVKSDFNDIDSYLPENQPEETIKIEPPNAPAAFIPQKETLQDKPVMATKLVTNQALFNELSKNNKLGILTTSQLSDERTDEKTQPLTTNFENLTTMTRIIAVVFIIFIFIIGGFPVYIIAKKTNIPNEWYAFIPILNIYLLCKISGRPVWWIILYFVPIVNWITDILVWMNIAKIRRKPSWMGIFIIIFPINLIMMWYLALSDSTQK